MGENNKQVIRRGFVYNTEGMLKHVLIGNHQSLRRLFPRFVIEIF